MSWKSIIQDPERQKALRVRSKALQAIRLFFDKKNFLEVETPIRVSCPAMEAHLKAFELKDGTYLQTSPEFAMKKLLAGGFTKIYQLARSFRDEPFSPHHLNEFTMLEWYHVGIDYFELMNETVELIQTVTEIIHGQSVFSYLDQTIDVSSVSRFRVEECFKSIGIDLVKCQDSDSLRAHAQRLDVIPPSSNDWDDLYFALWLNCIEPNLPKDRIVIIYDYPASQSALAKTSFDKNGVEWSRRFEVYLGGIELGNAFDELTDPSIQRQRFEKENLVRAKHHPDWPQNPVDEDLISALNEGIAECAGIAIGFDRLVQLLSGVGEISKTVYLPTR